VGLVVEHQDVLHAHQVGHNTLDHLAFGFLGLQVIAGTPLKQLLAAFGNFNTLSMARYALLASVQRKSMNWLQQPEGARGTTALPSPI
jgi:hypothetical protein